MTRVLVVGDVMRDIVVRPTGPLRPGTDTRAAIAMLQGGGGANQAAWLVHAGVPARLLACVGAADLDHECRRLERLGVEPALQAHADRPTGALIAVVAADGERSFLTDRGANDELSEAALPARLLDGITHLHVSGYAMVGQATRATVSAVIARARARGLPLSFDPGSAGFLADGGPDTLLAPLRDAEFCILNQDEAAIMTGLSDPAAQATLLARRHRLAVVKCGVEGARAAEAGGRCWFVPARRVAVVDTIGAGDAFLAGFLSVHLSGGDVPGALDRGAALAAVAVAQPGGAPPLA